VGWDYTFLDRDAPAGALTYWLSDHTRDGTVTWHGPVAVTRFSPTRLLQNAPNPFMGSTSFLFDLGRQETVLLQVFDIVGRVVAEPLSAPLAAGFHEVPWAGTDDEGNRLPPGIYFYRLTTGEEVLAGKLVLER
jgi:hypothetical protein